jgi:hypothetical protein
MIYQCPKCELRFERATELDYHCRNDHPDFRHEYPATKAAAPPTPPPTPAPPPAPPAAPSEAPGDEPRIRGWIRRRRGR